MSRKQTIIILHYKYTVSRRRDRVQAPAPTAAAGRVHYTRRGGIIRPTYSSVLALLLPPPPSALAPALAASLRLFPSLSLSLTHSRYLYLLLTVYNSCHYFSLLLLLYSTRLKILRIPRSTYPCSKGIFALEY